MNLSNLTEAKEQIKNALEDIADIPRELGFECSVKCSFFNAAEAESESPEGAECIFGEIYAEAEGVEEGILFSAAACVFEGEDGIHYISAEEINSAISKTRREIVEYFDKIKAVAQESNCTPKEAYKKLIDEAQEPVPEPKPRSNKWFYIYAGAGAVIIAAALTVINLLLKK